MKMYVCKKCGHIEFSQVVKPCPVCLAPPSEFVEDDNALKKPANPAMLTDGDKKHIPLIIVDKKCGLIPNGGCTDVHVKIGEINHVMEDTHWIQFIDVYLNSHFISRIELTPACNAVASLHIKASSGTIRAIESCNVHGKWMTEKLF